MTNEAQILANKAMRGDAIFVALDAREAAVAAMGIALAGAALTALLIVVLMPLMRRYAMARPTARGLHTAPTPQGGGLAIMLALVIVALGATSWLGVPLAALPASVAVLLGGASLLAALGAADDILSLAAGPRLLAQFAVAAAVVWSAPTLLVARWGEAAILVWFALATVGLAWFVNLTNFMDGMDGMTVVGLGVPATFAALANLSGFGDPMTGLLALAAVGGLIGFAPFNAPRARLFLGDVGSLSLGIVVGTALLRLAAAGHIVPALIAPLYYLADATITLFLRWRRGEKLSQAHRGHFYQRAATGGVGVWAILARVGALNLALAGLASAALAWPAPTIQLGLLAVAAGLVAATLRRLARTPA